MSLVIKPLVLTTHQTQLLRLSQLETFELKYFARHKENLHTALKDRTRTRSSHFHFHVLQHSALRNIGRKSPQRAHLLRSVCPQHDELVQHHAPAWLAAPGGARTHQSRGALTIWHTGLTPMGPTAH